MIGIVNNLIAKFKGQNIYSKHSLTYLGPMLWNKPPSKIRTLPSLKSFKNCIRKCDLNVLVGQENNCSNCILCNSYQNDIYSSFSS